MTDLQKQSIPLIKSADTLKREITYVYYEPLVVDDHGNWATAEVIEKACDNFNENLKLGKVSANLFHSKNKETGKIEPTDSFEVIKSWVSPTECVIGDTEVVEGTWLVKVKIKNDVLWDKILDGTISGVSFGALGSVRKENTDGA